MTLPTDAAARKAVPVYSGFLRYFPRAVAAVAELSRVSNEQHNPGEPLHWSRDKSSDHHDCLARHLLQAGTMDSDGQRHSAKVAWRAMAALELELEAAGAPLARGARVTGFEGFEQVFGMPPGTCAAVAAAARDYDAVAEPYSRLAALHPFAPGNYVFFDEGPLESSYLDSFGPNPVNQRDEE
jgi:hypothetical protein